MIRSATPQRSSKPAPSSIELSSGDQIELLSDLLRLGQPVDVRVAGPCMRPWAFGGDRLRVEAMRRPLRRGDVVLTRTETGLFAHRVVSVAARTVRTRGDLSDVADPDWRPDQVLGQVVAVQSKWGYRLPLDARLLGLVGLWAAPGFRMGVRCWRRLRGALQAG